MHEVAQLYKAHRNSFPTGGRNWVVCAVFEGELALPDQELIIKESLTSLGLTHSSVTYKATVTNQREFPGQGTVFVDGSRHRPVVYVEDKEVSNSSHWSSFTATSHPYGAWSSTYVAQMPSPSSGSVAYAQGTPISYSTGSAAYQTQTSVSSIGSFAYTKGISTSYGTGSSTNPSQSSAQAGPSQVGASPQASYKERYYYVK